MNIDALQTDNYRTDYAGYTAAENAEIDEFYDNLSSAVEKSETGTRGDVLGLTMLPYSDNMSYGMAAFYSEESTSADPIIRVSSNYGGERRYYNVHVNEVDPRNASQLEMFALSCYQDDQGITDGGTYGSFARMKAYAGNAADEGYSMDLQNPKNVYEKMDWVEMLEQMAQDYLKNPKTYAQYMDCKKLSVSFKDSNSYEKKDTDIKADLSKMIEEYARDAEEKIKNGETEPSYQIGGQSFTEEEWKKLIQKIDKDIDEIKEAQEEETEQKEDKTVNNEITEEQIRKLLKGNMRLDL